jgi:iron complex transport system permease protein
MSKRSPSLARLGLGAACLLGALLASLSFCLCIGSYSMSFTQVWAGLLDSQSDPQVRQVLWDLRLPRIVTAALSGAGLSVAGVVFQSLLRNPLADPFISGTSAGAGLGVAAAIAMGLGGLWLPAVAFVGAIFAVWTVYQLARVGTRLPIQTFLLAGVVVSSFLGSLVSLILTLAKQDLARILFWLMGNFGNADWAGLGWLFPLTCLAGFGVILHSLDLNLLALGEEQSALLGLNAEASKLRLIILASLLTATSVASGGLIGFVGLVVPHSCRRIVGGDHRVLIPCCAALGACFLMLADTLARSLTTIGDLPVGIVTSVVGAPFFLYLLRSQQHKYAGN